MSLQTPRFRFQFFAYLAFFISLTACSPPSSPEKEIISPKLEDISVADSNQTKTSTSTIDTKGTLPSESRLYIRDSDNNPSNEPSELKKGEIQLPKQLTAVEVVEDLDEYTRKLGESLLAERNSVTQTLNELGYEPLNNFSEYVSARAQLEFAMKRAEVGSGNNDGAKQLLIYFRDKYQASSVAMQIDPVLQGLGYATTKEFIFSKDVQAVRKVKLESLDLEKAVTKFVTYQPSYFEMKTHAFRCCLKNTSPQKYDEIVLNSKNHKELLTNILNREAPPPTQKEKMRVFARGYQAESIARQIDPNLNQIIDSLEDQLPERYRVINNAPTESVPTFAVQKSALKEAADQAALAGDSLATNFLQGVHLASNDVDFDAKAEAIKNSAKAFSPTSMGYPNSAGTRGSVVAVKAFDRFIKETFEGANSISKKFVSASRSIRGPGGISFGADIIESPSEVPQKIAWISHSQEPEFGYFLFKLGADKSITARSKWMYAESAAAAWIALFNPLSQRAEFKEKEVFTVVSIDRFYKGELSENERPITINPSLMGFQLAWSSARVDFWFSVGKAVRNDILKLYCTSSDEKCQAIEEEPKDVAWEAVTQMATWQFHDRPHYIKLAPATSEQKISLIAVCTSDNSNCLNEEVPSPHMTISPFARDDLLKSQILEMLVNLSAPQCQQQSTETAFMKCLLIELKSSISIVLLKAPSDESSTEINLLRSIQSSLDTISNSTVLNEWLQKEMNADPKPRDELAQRIQPLINWLITYHPDFIRLNDFAEAFTLLRWVKESGIKGAEVKGLTAELVPAIYPVPTIIELSSDGLKAKVE